MPYPQSFFFSPNAKKHLPSSKRGPDVRVDQAYAHRCILPPPTAEAQLQIDPQLPYKHTDSVNPFQPPAPREAFPHNQSCFCLPGLTSHDPQHKPPPSHLTLSSRHVGHDAMPAEDEIKDAAIKSQSSSTGTASGFSLSDDGEKNGFLPLLDPEKSN